MARLDFVEPAAAGGAAVEVHVSNGDYVVVLLSDADLPDGRFVCLSYWQLERITRTVRAEFAFQLDREEAEFGAAGDKETL